VYRAFSLGKETEGCYGPVRSPLWEAGTLYQPLNVGKATMDVLLRVLDCEAERPHPADLYGICVERERYVQRFRLT
jgi:hypothetical protein